MECEHFGTKALAVAAISGKTFCSRCDNTHGATFEAGLFRCESGLSHEQYSRRFPGTGRVFHALPRRCPVALATQVNVGGFLQDTNTAPP